MYWFQNVYSYFQTFFEFITFRNKPANVNLNDVENPEDYEYAILNDKNRIDN